MKNHIPLLVIVGPTATGKTAVAVEVAKKLNGEIVSADSMLIYRYMDIATAKPALEERQGIPHYMIDIVDPDESYSVALYQQQAKKHIIDIADRGRIPLLVGGTGLYVRAVVDHYNFAAGLNLELRRKLQEEAKLYGAEAIYRRLAKVDPETAARTHPNNLKRVIRALEVYYQTGRPISSFQYRYKENQFSWKLAMFGLIMERKELYCRIEQRVDKMMALGLIEEVKKLLERGYGPELISMRGLGYKEIIPYLNGEITLEEAVYLLKRDTRRFAKRQITWFGRDRRILWINVNQYRNLEDMAKKIIKTTEGIFKGTSKIS